MSKPLSAVEVAPEVRVKLPPEINNPSEEDSPPVDTPPVNVEVALSRAVNTPPEVSTRPSDDERPPVIIPPVNVEEAWSVAKMTPPETSRPEVKCAPSRTSKPELKVEVAPVPPTLITSEKVEEAATLIEEDALR